MIIRLKCDFGGYLRGEFVEVILNYDQSRALGWDRNGGTFVITEVDYVVCPEKPKGEGDVESGTDLGGLDDRS